MAKSITLDDIYGEDDQATTLNDIYGAGTPDMEREASIRKTLKQSALPVAGQLLGTGLGMMTGPAAPFAVPALEASLGMAGEGLNQALGITEEDPNQLLLQGAVPFGARLLGAAARPLMRVAPPTTRGAEFLNRMAAPEARLQMSKLAAPDPAPLFRRVSQSGAAFDTGTTGQTIAGELANLTRGANAQKLYGGTINVLTNLQQKLAQSGGRLSPDAFQAELRDLGAALKGVEGRTINDVEKGSLKNVYKSLAASLDQTGTTASRDLIEARRLIKRQSILDEIEESVTSAEKVLRGQGENVQFNAAAVLRDLKKNPFWTGEKGARHPAFTSAEKKQIESIFTLLNDIPALKPGAGVSAGSYQIARSIKSGAIAGGGTTAATGGDPVLSGAATAIGAALPTVVEFGRVLNIALRTETGRKALLAELKKPGATLATLTNAFLGAGVASQARPAPMPSTSMPAPFPMEP